jgi:hypothetical protein
MYVKKINKVITNKTNNMNKFVYYTEDNFFYEIKIEHLYKFIEDGIIVDNIYNKGFNVATHNNWVKINDNYESVVSILSKEEYDMLALRITPTKEGIQNIIIKLCSVENEQLLERLKKIELCAIKEQKNISEEDIINLQNEMNINMVLIDRNCKISDDYEQFAYNLFIDEEDKPENLAEFGKEYIANSQHHYILSDGRFIEIYNVMYE